MRNLLLLSSMILATVVFYLSLFIIEHHLLAQEHFHNQTVNETLIYFTELLGGSNQAQGAEVCSYQMGEQAEREDLPSLMQSLTSCFSTQD